MRRLAQQQQVLVVQQLQSQPWPKLVQPPLQLLLELPQLQLEEELTFVFL